MVKAPFNVDPIVTRSRSRNGADIHIAMLVRHVFVLAEPSRSGRDHGRIYKPSGESESPRLPPLVNIFDTILPALDAASLALTSLLIPSAADR